MQVETVLPLTTMVMDGKEKAEQAIRKIREKRCTNLSGGLFEALDILHRIKASDATFVESVLLFTDGRLNEGITNKDAIVEMTRCVYKVIL